MVETGLNPKLPTWDGDWRTFLDYQLACWLESDGMKEEARGTLAPRLARNLSGKAWEACLDMDREKLTKHNGLEYLLDFLKRKRGKQQVDMLKDALNRYFQSTEVCRRLNDYDQRVMVYMRNIQRALKELGSENSVPSEIFGWFLLNQHIKLESGDVATIESQAGSYQLDKVWETLRRMWGGESLFWKDAERRKQHSGSKTFAVSGEDWPEEGQETSIWWNDPDAAPADDEDDESPGETEIWFEEALAALENARRMSRCWRTSKKAFYKDARRALDQSKGKGKASAKGKVSRPKHRPNKKNQWTNGAPKRFSGRYEPFIPILDTPPIRFFVACSRKPMRRLR